MGEIHKQDTNKYTQQKHPSKTPPTPPPPTATTTQTTAATIYTDTKHTTPASTSTRSQTAQRVGGRWQTSQKKTPTPASTPTRSQTQAHNQLLVDRWETYWQDALPPKKVRSKNRRTQPNRQTHALNLLYTYIMGHMAAR